MQVEDEDEVRDSAPMDDGVVVGVLETLQATPDVSSLPLILELQSKRVARKCPPFCAVVSISVLLLSRAASKTDNGTSEGTLSLENTPKGSPDGKLSLEIVLTRELLFGETSI